MEGAAIIKRDFCDAFMSLGQRIISIFGPRLCAIRDRLPSRAWEVQDLWKGVTSQYSRNREEYIFIRHIQHTS